MVLPVGTDTEVRRLPQFTLLLIVANLLIFVGLAFFPVADTEEELNLLHSRGEEVVQRIREQFPLAVRDAEQGHPAMSIEVLEALRRGGVPPPANPLATEANAVLRDFRVLLKRDLYLSLGIVPSHLNPSTLLTAMFLHGSWLHVLSNMYFLWLAGCSLEDVWRWRILGLLYVSGASAAALTHVLCHPSSPVPVIGASGAVAAVMGAFMVRFAHDRIRFVLLWVLGVPRRVTFRVKVWPALSVWLAQQVFFAAMSRGTNSIPIAFEAHIGGFLFGMAAALFIRRHDLETRLRQQEDEAATVFRGDASVEAAVEAMRAGRYAEADARLREIQRREPRNPDLLYALLEVARRRGVATSALEHAYRQLLEVLVASRRRDEALAIFREAYEAFGVLALPGPSLLRLATWLEDAGPAELAVETYAAYLRQHGDSAIAENVLFRLARFAEHRLGDASRARTAYDCLLLRFPGSALAEEATRALRRLAARS